MNDVNLTDVNITNNVNLTDISNICIFEVDKAGNYISIKNNHAYMEHDIGNFRLKRQIGNNKEILNAFVVTVPVNLVVRPLETVKLYANGKGDPSNKNHINIMSVSNWGYGPKTITTLQSKSGLQTIAEYTTENSKARVTTTGGSGLIFGYVSLRTLLIIIGVLLVIIGLGVGAFFVFRK
uniref:LTD domain-containing protein n=1 Tax=Rhabditophanes sp. KR3021 TaxID=114890 RepID=A0AC35U5Y7_9BILA